MSEHGIQTPTVIDSVGGVQMGYCPGRDFINIYPLMLKRLAECYDKGYWPTINADLAKQLSVDEAVANSLLVDALVCHQKFIQHSCENPDEKYDDVLRRVGWFELPSPVRVMFYSMLGALVSGQIFAGIRDVSLAGESPPKHWQLVLEKYWTLGRRSTEADDWGRKLLAVHEALLDCMADGGETDTSFLGKQEDLLVTIAARITSWRMRFRLIRRLLLG